MLREGEEPLGVGDYVLRLAGARLCHHAARHSDSSLPMVSVTCSPRRRASCRRPGIRCRSRVPTPRSVRASVSSAPCDVSDTNAPAQRRVKPGRARLGGDSCGSRAAARQIALSPCASVSTAECVAGRNTNGRERRGRRAIRFENGHGEIGDRCERDVDFESHGGVRQRRGRRAAAAREPDPSRSG